MRAGFAHVRVRMSRRAPSGRDIVPAVRGCGHDLIPVLYALVGVRCEAHSRPPGSTEMASWEREQIRMWLGISVLFIVLVVSLVLRRWWVSGIALLGVAGGLAPSWPPRRARFQPHAPPSRRRCASQRVREARQTEPTRPPTASDLSETISTAAEASRPSSGSVRRTRPAPCPGGRGTAPRAPHAPAGAPRPRSGHAGEACWRGRRPGRPSGGRPTVRLAAWWGPQSLRRAAGGDSGEARGQRPDGRDVDHSAAWRPARLRRHGSLRGQHQNDCPDSLAARSLAARPSPCAAASPTRRVVIGLFIHRYECGVVVSHERNTFGTPSSFYEGSSASSQAAST